jgi:hypothetical protein
MTYGEMLSLFDAWAVQRLSWAIHTRTVAAYTPELIDALVEAGWTLTSQRSGTSIHNFHDPQLS